MSSELKPLSSPRKVIDTSEPFKGDLFEREAIAAQLTEYLERLKDGTVLAIDAPWGEGKSWFGRNWSSSLKIQGYQVVYLDAFEQDYIEDPFLLIASEISQLIVTDVALSEGFKLKAAKVMKAILPLSTKVLINLATRVALGSVDASDVIEESLQAASDSTGDASQIWLEAKIEEHAKEKESLVNFRSSLKEFCSSQDKPVVFFIDELDRCSPTFAVKLIERLKHFFDAPNLVFVLLLNRVQLEIAIQGVYGAKTDAATYLGKFIHMYLRLPKSAEPSGGHSNANSKYLRELSKHYKFQETQDLEGFVTWFSVLASIMGMSLRDLEKGMALLALNGPSSSSAFVAWPIALKLNHPNIFNGLLRGDLNAHKLAIVELEKIISIYRNDSRLFKYFFLLHTSIVGEVELTAEQNQELNKLKPSNLIYTDNPLHYWLNRIDIAT